MSTLTIAVTGPSSSGKTSLSHLLRHLFSQALPSPVVIVHADDFYVADSQIPLRKIPNSDPPRELADWDCPEALDFDRTLSTLRHVKQHGTFPDGFKSYEGEDTSQQKELERALGTDVIKELTKEAVERIRKCLGDDEQKQQRVVIVDGFLLLGKGVPADVIDEFDIRILLRATYERAKFRRENRQGYVTIEGYWQDPPGYFDDIVWPGYLAQHEYLFEKGDVEQGRLADKALEQDIRSPFKEDDPTRELSLEEVAKWAVEEVLTELEKRHAKR